MNTSPQHQALRQHKHSMNLVEDKTFHLFGGEREYCTPGMDGYIQQCADIYEAVRIAEQQRYEWAQIIQVTTQQLRIINVGRWDNRRNAMIWQANTAPVTANEAYIRSFHDVLKSGIMLLARLPGSDYRRAVMNTSLNLLDEIEQISDKHYPPHLIIYFMRQMIDKMQDTIQRTSMPKKKDLFRKRWLRSASALLEDTKLMTFTNERDA